MRKEAQSITRISVLNDQYICRHRKTGLKMFDTNQKTHVEKSSQIGYY